MLARNRRRPHGTTAHRPQDAHSQGTRLPQRPPREGARTSCSSPTPSSTRATCCRSSTRCCAGSREEGESVSAARDALRPLAPDVLHGAARLRGGRAPGPGAGAPRAAAGAQARRRGGRGAARAARERRPPPSSRGAGGTGARAVRALGAPAQHRARSGAAKKTPVNGARRHDGPSSPARFATSYERLRRVGRCAPGPPGTARGSRFWRKGASQPGWMSSPRFPRRRPPPRRVTRGRCRRTWKTRAVRHPDDDGPPAHGGEEAMNEVHRKVDRRPI